MGAAGVSLQLGIALVDDRVGGVNRVRRDVTVIVFFFSSRRRHTISDRDWSSDVCSSDLGRRRRIGVSGLVDGTHAFAVYAVDAAGNADTTPSAYSWTVDTIAPETTITAGPQIGRASCRERV